MAIPRVFGAAVDALTAGATRQQIITYAAVIANDAEALELESLSFTVPRGADVGLAVEGSF